MAEYLVSWGINLDADTPEGAAAQALDIQRGPDSRATAFDITDAAGETKRIDVAELALPVAG